MMQLHNRDLPKLIITTSKSTSTSSKNTPTTTKSSSNAPTNSVKSRTSLPNLITTSSTSTTSSINTPSITSSITPSVTPSPVFIPSAQGNKFIFHSNQPTGTVFIAVGAALGFTLLVLLGLWFTLNIRAWKRAHNDNKIKQRDAQYQYDPYLGDDISSLDSQDSCDHYSDISEIILKQNSGRDYPKSSKEPKMATADDSSKKHAHSKSRISLFISPTELLQQNVYASTTVNTSDPSVSLGHGAGTPVSNPSTNTSAVPTTKHHRPPSVSLDNLLDSV